MFKTFTLAVALTALVSTSAMATGSNSGSRVSGHNSASAGAQTGSAALSTGNGFSVNSGTAMQTSASSLNLQASPSLVGATGAASTSGLTTNHSYTEGTGAALGSSKAHGSADFSARGRTSGTARAYDGTRAKYDGKMNVKGGTIGSSKTSSAAAFGGNSGGAAYNEGSATGKAEADFDFNRYTGADSKTAEVDTTSHALAETTKYRSGFATVDTKAGNLAGAKGFADVDAQLRLRR